MLNETKLFNELGYVHLEEFLDVTSCDELSNELLKSIRLKQTTRDEQCPKSEAIYGHPTFDSLLEQLLPQFEAASGKKLIPTYSYARLYYPGEVLENHTDRESCEISATITLNFEGDVWPIYFGSDIHKNGSIAIKMQTGDAVLYRGMDKYHWREEYTEGKWQAQVFLHYVDANGKYTDRKFDKRGNLGSSPKIIDDFQHWIFSDILTEQACDIIIKTYDNELIEKLPPSIGSGNGAIDTNIRNVERIVLPTYKDIGGRLAAAGLAANFEAWKFDVTHSNQAEFLKYPAQGKYVTHVDTFMNPSEPCRKLTVLAFLNDDFEGGKFYIQTGDKRYYPKQDKGTVLVFPSFMPHGVENITKGTRYSVVCWLVGPFFK